MDRSFCAGVGSGEYITPADTTIGIGASVTLRFVFRDAYCVGSEPRPPEQPRPTHWHSKDTLLITLDTLTGVVVGRAVGDAVVLNDISYTAVVRVR